MFSLSSSPLKLLFFKIPSLNIFTILLFLPIKHPFKYKSYKLLFSNKNFNFYAIPSLKSTFYRDKALRAFILAALLQIASSISKIADILDVSIS